MLALLLLLRSVWLGPAPTLSGAALSGTVTDSLSGELLPSVQILLFERKPIGETQSPLRIGTTNKFGFYAIPNISTGSYTLVVRMLGYAEYQRLVEMKDPSLRIDIQLVQQAIDLQEIIIEAERTRASTTPVQSIRVRTDLLRRLPSISGEPDLLRSLQLLPGVKAESEISGGLYVRGSSPDHNLTLLDGMPVFNPSHLGGLLSTFNSDALSDVQLIKGAFPAEYGGRTSSVLDISMRNGTKEKLSGSAGLSLLSARLMLEGPIAEGSTFMISGRRMYADLLVPVFADEKKTPTYFFYDVNGKATFEISQQDRIVVSAYAGRDVLIRPPANEDVNFDIDWKNTVAGVRWLHIHSPGVYTNLSLIYSGYGFSTRIRSDPNSGYQDYRSSSGIADIMVRGEFQLFPHENHTVKLGVEAIRNGYEATAADNTSQQLRAYIPPTSLTSFDGSMYVQDDWTLSDALTANLGARLNVYSKGEFKDFEPRVSALYAFGDALRVRSSFALAHQYLHLVTRNDIVFPTDLWLRSEGGVPPARTVQTTFGVEADLFGGEYRLGIESYYKATKNLYEYKETAGFSAGVPTAENFTSGTGEAYGVELMLEKRVGPFTGWLGYTLAWTTRTFAELNNGIPFYPHYDRRHDVSLVMTYRLNERWEFGATWVYAAGQAYSLPVGKFNFRSSWDGIERSYYDYAERNGERLPSFHKLDVNASYGFTWFKLPFTISLNVYNLYNRQNPFARYIKLNKQSTFPLTYKATLNQLTLFPILPTLGLSCTF